MTAQIAATRAGDEELQPNLKKKKNKKSCLVGIFVSGSAVVCWKGVDTNKMKENAFI